MKKAIVVMILATACSRTPDAPATPRPTAVPKDASTYANLDAFVATHLVLDLTADFTAKTLSGTAELTFDRRDPNATEVVLDTRDLKIDKVEAATGSGAWMGTTHRLDAADARVRQRAAHRDARRRQPRARDATRRRRRRAACSGSRRARRPARSSRFSSARRRRFRRGRSFRCRTRPACA